MCLQIFQKYVLERQPNNRRDPKAVAIVDTSGVKRASLKRDAAELLSKIMDSDLDINWRVGVLLKPKAPTFFHSPRFGTAQRCNVGFFCGSHDEEAVRQILFKNRFSYRFIK